MTTPHKTTPKTDNQRNSNDIEIFIAATMKIPSTESDIGHAPKAQEQQEAEGRELRRRRKRDYIRLNTIEGSESEVNQQQTNKEKTQPQKSKTQKMKLEQANKQISELLDTVTLF